MQTQITQEFYDFNIQRESIIFWIFKYVKYVKYVRLQRVQIR